MNISRRHLVHASAAAAGALAASAEPTRAAPLTSTLGRDATQYGVRPNSADDQTRALQRAINETSAARVPLALPPGRYRTGMLTFPDGAQLAGVRGATILNFIGGASMIASEGANGVTLTNLLLDGGGIAIPERRGLVHILSGHDVRIRDCEIVGSGGCGIFFDKVAGEIAGNIIRKTANTAITSFDALGLLVAQNTIQDASDNGIEIIRNEIGEDGTLVINNRIEDMKAGPGGSGQYGNAINAVRAGNVLIDGNRIRNCAFSAVRCNAASNIHITGNNVTNVGEVALYSEFGFEGAIIANNIVDICATGISVANFNEGGRLSVVQGNIIRNLTRRPQIDPQGGDAGFGIYIEADTSVTGNVVENATSFGIVAGWGKYLRDVSVTGNVVRNADVGIGVSVLTGAGTAMVGNNFISGATRSAIAGLDHGKPITGDLSLEGASRFSQIALSGNVVR